MTNHVMKIDEHIPGFPSGC